MLAKNLLSKLKCPREEDEAKWLIEWAHYRIWRGERLSKLLIHIPNGAYLGSDAKTRGITMGKLKAAGLQPGCFDYLIPVPCPPLKFPGLWLELKRLRGGSLDEDQSAFALRMERLGWRTEVACGWVQASEIIDRYLYACGESTKPIGNAHARP